MVLRYVVKVVRKVSRLNYGMCAAGGVVVMAMLLTYPRAFFTCQFLFRCWGLLEYTGNRKIEDNFFNF